jgi:hypothetical protein
MTVTFHPGQCGVCRRIGMPWADTDRLLCTQCAPRVFVVMRCPCGSGSVEGAYPEFRRLDLGFIHCKACGGSANDYVLERCEIP